jgi:hypothetical protein
MADPVSWLQIEQGWKIVGADGISIGAVAQVAGDRHEDIFDGLALRTEGSKELRYVPGEQVGGIVPGQVTLTIAASEAGALAPYHESPPETKWVPGKAPLGRRLSNWLQGKR